MLITQRTKGLISGTGEDSTEGEIIGMIDSELEPVMPPSDVPKPDFSSFNYYDDSPWDSYIRQTRTVV